MTIILFYSIQTVTSTPDTAMKRMSDFKPGSPPKRVRTDFSVKTSAAALSEAGGSGDGGGSGGGGESGGGGGSGGGGVSTGSGGGGGSNGSGGSAEQKKGGKLAKNQHSPKPSSSKPRAKCGNIDKINIIFYYCELRTTTVNQKLFFYFAAVKGIRQISPERRPDAEYKKPLNNSTAVLEFQFHSYLQMEGVDKKMLDNSK